MSIKYKNKRVEIGLAMSISLLLIQAGMPGQVLAASADSDLMNVFAEPMRLGNDLSGAVTFSPDGTILAAAQRTDPASAFDSKQAVILWDPQTQEQIDVLEIANIVSIAFSPDSTLLALAQAERWNNSIHLWDVANRRQVGVMPVPTEWGGVSLAFSPVGETLASSDWVDSTLIRLWDVQTQQQAAALTGHQYSVMTVAFSPDGKLLASGGFREDEAIRLWDVQAQEQVGALTGHLDGTLDLAFSPDGTLLASAGGILDKAVYLWNVETQNRVGVLGGHSAHVGSIAFSPNGTLLASTVYWDDSIYFWEIESQEQVGVFKGHDSVDFGGGSRIALSSDGKWLACGSENGVELWQLKQPETMLAGLMLYIMNKFYIGNIDAELAWNSLVKAQTALAALDGGVPSVAQLAMDELKALIDQEKNPRKGRITPEAAADIIQRANEIVIIVALGS